MGLQDLKSKGIVHCDLRPSNILLNFPNQTRLGLLTPQMKLQFLKKVDLMKVNLEVKIANFGLSRILGEEQVENQSTGNPLYMSPQMLTH